MKRGMLFFALLTNIKLLIYQLQQKHCRAEQCLHGRICRKISEAFLLNQENSKIILISASLFLTGLR